MYKAFTLFELLCVIVIMSIIMAITLAFLPSMESRLASQGADQLQTYIAAARARAMRDNVTSGIRLIPDSTGNFTSFQFIQSPEPFAPPGVSLSIAAPALNSLGQLIPSNIAIFNTGSLSGSIFDIVTDGGIAVGDLLEIVPSGLVHRVTVLNPSGIGSIQVATVMPGNPLYPQDCQFQEAAVSAWSLIPISAPTNAGFRFIREPRPLMGETPQQLPRRVRVNNTLATINGVIQSNPSVIHLRNISGSNNVDIIFAPSGQVINAIGSHIILWIDDSNGSGNNSSISQPTLLCINARTGGVSAHPLAPYPSPGFYAFVFDGLSSGQ